MIRSFVTFLLSGIIAFLVPSLRGNAEIFDFQILPAQANPSSLEITIEAVGDSDSDSSAISGTARLELDSPVAPFGAARILDLTLIMEEGLDFRLGPLNLLRGSSGPGDLSAILLSPGPKAPVINGTFSQVDNLIGVDGEVVLSVLDDPFDLSTLDPLTADMNDVQISLDGSQLNLGVDLDLRFETVMEDVPVLGTVPVVITLVGSINGVANTAVPGDFDGNGLVEVGDINTLTTSILLGSDNPSFDLNNDGQVDSEDRVYWVEEIAKTFFGDSDLNGEFNSGDLVMAFASAEYEDGMVENSSWDEGDWSGDLEFDSTDFVVAFSHGGFEIGPRSVAVPEIATFLPAVLLVVIAKRRRYTFLC